MLNAETDFENTAETMSEKIQFYFGEMSFQSFRKPLNRRFKDSDQMSSDTSYFFSQKPHVSLISATVRAKETVDECS